MDRKLVEFFKNHRSASFRQAISEFCRFYGVKRPSIEWYEYIDWGKTAGRTFEDGRIHLVHPENWKRGRVYKSERMWVQTVYHELGHYLFWTDAERKADTFAHWMVHGLRRCTGRTRVVSHSRRSSAARANSTRDRAARVAARRSNRAGDRSRRASARGGNRRGLEARASRRIMKGTGR